MKSINVSAYKNDPKSLYTYLGAARVKTITFQHTENPKYKLLDILFETVLDDQTRSEFLIRLETSMVEIQTLFEELTHAIKNPKPHPWDEDLFDKAVIGKTTREPAIPGATPRSCGLVSPWAQERGRQVYLN